MKRILTIFAVVLSIFILCIPASAAETYDDLSRIYNNLTTYIYKPYFQNSKYFEEYETQLDYVAELLKAENLIQEEIDNGYQSLKSAYSNMMKDTYDYSELPVLISAFEKLDKTIFTDESWKNLLSVVDGLRTELDSPAIYFRNETYTEESYRAKTQSYIDSFETNYASAFNQLKFNEAISDGDLTKSELKSFHSYVSACVNENYMKIEAEFYDLKAALDDAEKIYNRANPNTDLIEEAKTEIEKTYFALNQKFIDFSMLREEISTFRTLSKSSFEEKSFLAYSEKIDKLIAYLDEPHFFYIPADCDAKSFEAYSKIYLESLVSSAKSAYKYLIPIKLVNQLQGICNQYKNTTTIDGLELKLSLLQNAIKKGQELLQAENTTSEQYESAIKAIGDAYSDLKVAEGFLIEEQSETVKQDAETIKTILIYALIAVALSIGFACFISKLRYGIIDWTK